MCKKILGYDGNTVYLSTMQKPMPCGKGEVAYFDNPAEIAGEFTRKVLVNGWFGFAEVDSEIPRRLWGKFEEMCPFFVNKQVPHEAVAQHMLDYLQRTGRHRGDGRKLVGALAAEKMLVYEPLLHWYLAHGAVIKDVHRTIDYERGKIFTWFVDKVMAGRRTGDVDKSKALLADVYKLLWNSAYDKMIKALERQTSVSYTKSEKKVDRALRSAYFADLDEIGEAYELEIRRKKIKINCPFQVGIAVYQLAKLWMLEFYYDFLDRLIDRKDFELIQMDMDSNYLAISGETLEELVKREKCEEFKAEKRECLTWDKWSKRTPGLFKLEFEGRRENARRKNQAKGMLKRHNAMQWARFKGAREGETDMAQNRGFSMREGRMMTDR